MERKGGHGGGRHPGVPDTIPVGRHVTDGGVVLCGDEMANLRRQTV